MIDGIDVTQVNFWCVLNAACIHSIWLKSGIRAHVGLNGWFDNQVMAQQNFQKSSIALSNAILCSDLKSDLQPIIGDLDEQCIVPAKLKHLLSLAFIAGKYAGL